MAESYSERHGRKPSIGVEALVELVFRKLADFERRGYFQEALETYREPSGEEHPARLPHPEQYVIAQLGRPGLWRWLGDLGRVVAEEHFPPWDLDTLFDVIELFDNVVVSAPMHDADEVFEGWSRSQGRHEFREAMNEALPLANPPAQLTDEGRIVEISADRPEPKGEPPRYDVFISHAREEGNGAADLLAQSLEDRGYRVSAAENGPTQGEDLKDQLAAAMGSSRSRVVVLSPEFFAGGWTRAELDLLAEREPTDGRAPIILVSHNVDADEVRAVDPLLAERLGLSIDVGLGTVVRAIERALQRANGDEPRVPGAGADDRNRAEDALTNTATRASKDRNPIVAWFIRNRDPLVIGMLVTVIGGIIVGLFLRSSGSSPGGTTGGDTGNTTIPSTTGKRKTEAPPANQSSIVIEYADNREGSPVYSDPTGSPVEGAPGRIPYGAEVAVSCFAANETGMNSVSGFYRVASGRWRGDYVVADTMTNGGPVGTTTTPNIDPRVPRCSAGE